MINATNNGSARELIPAGNFLARCYSMIHIGTIKTEYMGETKTQDKVRIGFELPTEKKVFNPERGEQPYVISQEFTLSMHEKSNLRKSLASWRGRDFTEKEAAKFDISVLIGKECMLNIIHKLSQSGKEYHTISSISGLPRGMICPPQINETFLLDYDNFSHEKFHQLPDFIQEQIKGSKEYQKMMRPNESHLEEVDEYEEELIGEPADDLPF